MPGEFWTLVTMLFSDHGFLALFSLGQVGLIVWLVKRYLQLEKEKSVLQEKLLGLSERRLADAKEEKEEYEDLARDLEKSVDLLVKAFRKKSDSNGDEG